MNGYAGKFLKVNLTTKKLCELTITEKTLRKYIGGSGLGAKILGKETGGDTHPLSPENVLFFATGPFTGTGIPSSGRHSVIAKSPLTGIWGESDVGGHWGTGLKMAGYDGIVIKGSSDKPAYIFISDKETEIRDASHLWGMDTYETDNSLKKDIGRKFQTASIGPAGEKMILFASIMHNGKHGRAAGRSGLGAVMGSKNLKALVVSGKTKTAVAREKELQIQVKNMLSRIKKAKATSFFRRYGTSGGLMALEATGDMPIKNITQGKWPEAEKLSGEVLAEKYLTGKFACGGCPIACGRNIKISSGKYAGVNGAGPEYESICSLGTYCLVNDLSAVCKANELCNRYGMDTISVGAAIAFAMEAYEKRIINENDCGGLSLKWGDADAIVEMVCQIGEKRRLGAILGLGVRNAAEILGKNAQEFAIHVKGLEFPAHDPRAFFSSGLSYATSNRGACHLAGLTHSLEGSIAMPELGYPEILDRFTCEGKGAMVAKMQNLMGLFDSLKICKFLLYTNVSIGDLVNCLNSVTGWDVSLEEFLHTGERIFNLKRMYNIGCGINKKDDTLPFRITGSPLREGGTIGNLPDLEKMLHEYYIYRGWNQNGIPNAEKLKELDIESDTMVS